MAAKAASKAKSKPGRVKHIPLDERVIHRFFMISKRFDQALVAMHSKKLGISVNNAKILRVIAFSGPLSATELGGRMSLDPDKITRAIDTLVDRSYVIRKENEADRRKVVLTLSAKGRRAHDKIEMVVSAMEFRLPECAHRRRTQDAGFITRQARAAYQHDVRPSGRLV